MKVAVLEFLCGGGLQKDPNSQSLVHEGLAMLSGLAIDLALCGHEVHTCLDRNGKIKGSFFGRLTVHEVHRKNDDVSWMDQWIEVAMQCDQTIVIAPEIDQQLERIVDRLRRAGVTVVASSGDFLKATSDKLATAKLLQASQIPHPATETLSHYREFADHLQGAVPSSAVTLKRRDGAGCVDMKFFVSQQKLTEWLENEASEILMGDEWIIQEWFAGRPASMALLAGEDWKLIGAVEQRIAFDDSSIQLGYSEVSYLGGTGPLAGVSAVELEHLAKRVRTALPAGAAGWIGIDFIVPNETDRSNDLVVIEVNPRLTTSYLGYRKWFGHTLADALLRKTNHSNWTIALNQQPIEFDAC